MKTYVEQDDSCFDARFGLASKDDIIREDDQEDETFEEEYDDSWDHLYDFNEFENKKRKINKSKKLNYNKQER